MKKLLLITLAMVSGTILAVPVAQNKQFSTQANKAEGSLASLVQSGNPPYMFQVTRSKNASVMVSPTGDFSATVTSYPAEFQYTVTDSSGDSSAPATITLVQKDKLK